MMYYVTISRNGFLFYVISPTYGVFSLSLAKEKTVYLWETEESARKDTRWQHLIEGGTVTYNRTYKL